MANVLSLHVDIGRMRPLARGEVPLLIDSCSVYYNSEEGLQIYDLLVITCSPKVDYRNVEADLCYFPFPDVFI